MICPTSQTYRVVGLEFEHRQSESRAFDLWHSVRSVNSNSNHSLVIKYLSCAWFSLFYAHRANFTLLGNHRDIQNLHYSTLSHCSDSMPAHRPQDDELLCSPIPSPFQVIVWTRNEKGSKDSWTLYLLALTRTKTQAKLQDAQ